jgi:hypothetical protein
LGTVYRQILEWKLHFSRLLEPDHLRKLRTIQSSMCGSVVSDIEEFSRTLEGRLQNAVDRTAPGENVELRLRPEFSAPDLTGLQRELDELQTRIRAGEISWD